VRETAALERKNAQNIVRQNRLDEIAEQERREDALNAKKLKLMRAEAAQDDAATHEAKMQLDLEERTQNILDSTNLSRAEAVKLAKDLQAAESGADTNQSGFVTAREQRAEESRQRTRDQERRKREREERAAEVGAQERQREKELNARMSGREMANGLITGAEGNQMPSGEIAPSIKTQENTIVEINKQTANNTKEILLEIQKNP
jgi:hypothetical protein